jgi:hypothetical protein
MFRYDNTSLGFVPAAPMTDSTISSLAGIYPNSTTEWFYLYKDYQDQDALNFRKYALFFDISRQNCSATWSITQTNITLLSGRCFGNKDMSQDLLWDTNIQPFPMDVVPVLVPSVAEIDRRAEGEQMHSPWLGPAYATAIATFWWARSVHIPDWLHETYPDLFYEPRNEKIVSHRLTLHPSWLLYLVLAVQPLICFFAFVMVTILYTVPIGPGFNIISLLARIDTDSVKHLNGAGFSGKISRPLGLAVRVEENAYESRVRFVIEEDQSTSSSIKLRRGQLYG